MATIEKKENSEIAIKASFPFSHYKPMETFKLP